MTDTNLTHLYFLLDRSGSMESIRTDVVGGFDAFIAEQRELPGRCRVSLAQFDDQYEEVYADRPIDGVPSLDLRPRGSTAMLDAIGRLIVSTGERLAALPEDRRPGTVLIGIMTDGMENASREFTRHQVRAMIKRQSSQYDWTFLYLGANQDAVEVGTDIGIDPGLAVTYAPSRAAEAMVATSQNVAAMRGAVMAGAPIMRARESARYSSDQRSDLAGDNVDRAHGIEDDIDLFGEVDADAEPAARPARAGVDARRRRTPAPRPVRSRRSA